MLIPTEAVLREMGHLQEEFSPRRYIMLLQTAAGQTHTGLLPILCLQGAMWGLVHFLQDHRPVALPIQDHPAPIPDHPIAEALQAPDPGVQADRHLHQAEDQDLPVVDQEGDS
jgi:hypothetical protein